MGIPVIDLFAGPGGLAEGFSSIFDEEGKRVFDVRLSIEMDELAHRTLQFRSFFRQFDKDKVPNKYYEVLRENDPRIREEKLDILFSDYPKEFEKAKEEAWRCELGNESEQVIDERIRKTLNSSNKWILVGGPPCQAFSLVGRSRVGGININDHRVYLYKEYLRIISKHQPSIFVMENVKGLLSARLDNKNIFEMILRDLKNPASVFSNSISKKYKILSFVKKAKNDLFTEEPIYHRNEDFLIRMEDYGIPQTRHRIILLGIREDIKIENPEILIKNDRPITIKEVIGDLPALRSGLSKRIVSSTISNRKISNKYETIVDTDHSWFQMMNKLRNELQISDKGVLKGLNRGANFTICKTKFDNIALQAWFVDERLKGVTCHETRSHLESDLKRYLFAASFLRDQKRFSKLKDFPKNLLPNHRNVLTGKFEDRFRVQDPNKPATTVTSHISKDGHYFIHYDPYQCRTLTVREAARIQTFPDNYYFWGNRTQQYHQVGNAVPPLLAAKLAKIVYNILKLI